MQTASELNDCLVLNTVAAARTLLRAGDAVLKPYGVTVQQFSLLAAIRLYQGEPVASLAKHIHLDRSSLTRNLNLLERKGLVGRVAETRGNQRVCALTDEGERLLDRLLPVWAEARARLHKNIPADNADTYLHLAKWFSTR